MVIALIYFFSSSSGSIEIQGSTARCEYEPLYTASKSSIARDLARLAYRAAKESDEVKKVVIKVTMSGSGLVDKFGNPIKGDMDLGTITYSVTDETRKYKDADTFALRNEDHFKHQVGTLNQAHLFED